MPYRNRNISILEGDDLWHTPCGQDAPVRNLLVSYYAPDEGDYAYALDLLTPMAWDAVSEWADSTVGTIIILGAMVFKMVECVYRYKK